MTCTNKYHGKCCTCTCSTETPEAKKTAYEDAKTNAEHLIFETDIIKTLYSTCLENEKEIAELNSRELFWYKKASDLEQILEKHGIDKKTGEKLTPEQTAEKEQETAS